MASSAQPRAIPLFVRVRLRIISRMATLRYWRVRHPLIVDMATVMAALVIFALLLADRQQLVEELACTANG